MDIDCGVKISLEVICGTWKTYILYELNKGSRRPSDMHRLFTDASRCVIYQQRQEWDLYGMLEKTVFHELPPHVEYSITEAGKSLMPIIQMLEKWGNEYRPKMKHILEMINSRQP